MYNSENKTTKNRNYKLATTTKLSSTLPTLTYHSFPPSSRPSPYHPLIVTISRDPKDEGGVTKRLTNANATEATTNDTNETLEGGDSLHVPRFWSGSLWTASKDPNLSNLISVFFEGINKRRIHRREREGRRNLQDSNEKQSEDQMANFAFHYIRVLYTLSFLPQSQSINTLHYRLIYTSNLRVRLPSSQK